MCLPPEAGSETVTLPIVGNAGAADETNTSVDREKLAMGAKIELRKLIEPKNLHLGSGALEHFHFRPMQAIAAERVLQKMHPHAPARARSAKAQANCLQTSPSLRRKFSNVIVRSAERIASSMAGKISSPFWRIVT